MMQINKLLMSKQLSSLRLLISSLHTTRVCAKAEDRKDMLASMPVMKNLEVFRNLLTFFFRWKMKVPKENEPCQLIKWLEREYT